MFENPHIAKTMAQVDLDGYGMSSQKPLGESSSCPESHYQCPGGFCIPTYLLNNGERDCFRGEDEQFSSENLTCPGFYRCHRTNNCVHPQHVCDGIPHCLHKDDELYCHLHCPVSCTCEGFAFVCLAMFDALQHFEVRYLDLSGVLEPSLDDIHFMEYLHFLNLSACHLKRATLASLFHLRVLDLSSNLIASLEYLKWEELPALRHLNLSNNPLVSHMNIEFGRFLQAASILQLKTLTMVNISLRYIGEGSFISARNLEELDVRRNELERFHSSVFQGLDNLRLLKTDSSQLCCFLPKQSSAQCRAPVDELSSCNDLLKSDFFRVFLWGFSLMAVSGNIGVLGYRLLLDKTGGKQAYRVLVVNLGVSDCLMGVYLLLIGVADAGYRGVYVSMDWQWRQSMTCKVSGFLALVSSEVSALVICLITLDRVLVLCFPFRVRLHITLPTAIAACGVVWGTGIVLAVVPLLPFASHWQFYSQTGICLPLPLTRNQFPGQGYTFAVFIVLNSVLFLFIGCGQLLIFMAIRRAGTAAKTQRRSQEITIARRLFLVVMSDFCCWFPIGVTGLLAKGGTPVPGDINVWAAVFILPLNSALNPFLYTLNAVREKWRGLKEERRIQKMINKLQAEIDTWPVERVEVLVKHCLRHRLSGRDIVPEP